MRPGDRNGDGGDAARWPVPADVAVPALLALAQLGGTWLLAGALDRTAWALVWAGVLGGAGALVWRRRAPLAVLAATSAVGAAAALAVHDADVLVGGVAECVALFSVAVRRDRRTAVAAALAVWAVTFLAFLPVRHGVADVLVAELIDGGAYLVILALGQTRRQQRARRRALAGRLAAGDAERRDAAAAERRRLARDLHDVAGHHLSAVAVHSTAAARVRDPAVARGALAAAAATGREVLAALAHLVDVVDAVDADAGGRLDRLLPPLCDGLARLGVPVGLEFEGRARRARPETVTAAYRIAQEALTNAVRYAPGAAVTVAVRYAPGRVRIEVVNTAPDPARAGGGGLGGGRGIDGMRERAAGVGGTLAAGPEPGGGWAVRADLPPGAPRRGPGWPEFLDGAVAAFCALLPGLLAFLPPDPIVRDPSPTLAALVSVGVAVRAAPLWWRRRAPWRTLAALVALDLAWSAAAAAFAPVAWAVLVVGSPASMIAVYAVARHAGPRGARTWPAPLVAAVPWAAGLTAVIAVDPDGGRPGDLAFGVLVGGGGALLVLTPFWAWGRAVALRAGRWEAGALETVEARAAEAVRAERHRIAIGLRGSVLDHATRLVRTAEAGAAAPAAEAPAALERVAGHARAALADMRALLDALDN
ncbi:sensor histidine kinase [Actinomadura atramentaria]|uniref:sensor histidine kinase n=1 Tax=Actinomadura atramentaria TaxID=1990 RepID=UPI00036BC084|nr:sensor histidine kinase [Actinomadura atramentaria]